MADYPFSVIHIDHDFIMSLQDLIGGVLLLPIDERGEKFLRKREHGEIVNVDVRKVLDSLRRSHEQLGLYWVLCKTVSDNTEDYSWNTPEKVDLQCKISCKLIDGFISYQDADGNQKIQLVLGSISFNNLAHLDACNYFTNAFQAMADHLKITVDELLQEGR